MIVVLDNYDSFTYNLVQLLGELGAAIEVYRNDAIALPALLARRPSAIVLSPGPGLPRDAGICPELARVLAEEPAMADGPRLLGVCLGHQTIAEACGAQLVPAPDLVHGRASDIFHDGAGLFRGLANPLPATRYHSWVVDPGSLPDCLAISARTSDGLVMGLRHRQRPIEGLQFHPESILTRDGRALLAHFLAGDEPSPPHSRDVSLGVAP